MSKKDDDDIRGLIYFLITLGITAVIIGIAFHWFDGIIVFITQLIQIFIILLIIGAVIYLIYYFLNFAKRRETEKENNIKMKIVDVRKKILGDLGWHEDSDYPHPDLLFEMTETEFNSQIKSLTDKKVKEEQYKKLLISRVIDSIINFKPAKQWHNEDSYHKELLGWLKQPFPEILYELQTGGSRPDLVIGKIAIEIKGPTDDNALNTLATKILKYSQYYDHVIIVLFEPSFSERNYHEITRGIEKTYSHVHVIRK